MKRADALSMLKMPIGAAMVAWGSPVWVFFGMLVFALGTADLAVWTCERRGVRTFFDRIGAR
jgi:hypothetical protein